MLERRYRRLLMLLPAAYRAHRGEEMLAVLLDSAPEQQRWPRLGEVLSLAAHIVRVRSGLRAESVSSSAAQTLMRSVALLGTLYLTFLSASCLLVGQHWYWGIYRSDINHSDLDGHHHALAEVVLVQAAGLVLGLGAFAAVLLGWRRVVQSAGWLLIVLGATQISGEYTILAAVPLLVFAAALIATARRPLEPAPHPGRWFAALAGVAAVTGALAWHDDGTFRQPAMTAPFVAVGVAVLAVGVLRAWRHGAEWAVAAAIVGGMAGAQRVLDGIHYPDFADSSLIDSQVRLMMIGEAVLILVAVYAIVRRRRRRSPVADGSGDAA